MSIQSEVARLESAKSAIAGAITAKGVTVPDTTKLDGYADLVSKIQAGGGGSSGNLMEFVYNNFTPYDISGDVYEITGAEWMDRPFVVLCLIALDAPVFFTIRRDLEALLTPISAAGAEGCIFGVGGSLTCFRDASMGETAPFSEFFDEAWYYVM